MRLFTYGTLKKGGKYHAFLNGAERVADQASVKGTLYDTGLGYPAMSLEHSNDVYGEVYEVPEELWASLDELEDCTGSPDDLYEKKNVPTYVGTEIWNTIVYVAKDEALLKQQIASGTWDVQFGKAQ